jgi:hypothetical protein
LAPVLLSNVQAALPLARFGADAADLPPISPLPPATEEIDGRLSRTLRFLAGIRRPIRVRGGRVTVAPCTRLHTGGVMKTMRERAEEKRQEKLDKVRQQLENGSLVIRQMTDAERQRYPVQPQRPKRGRQ